MNSIDSGSKLENSTDLYAVCVTFPAGLRTPVQTKSGFKSRELAKEWRDWIEDQLTERYNCSRAMLTKKGFSFEVKKHQGR